jgi:hypothetical protein
MMTCRLSLPSFDDVLALVAFAIVCADYAAALWTFVFSFLLCDEGVDPVVLYEFQVLEHAHVIFRAIAFVQLFQSSAAFFAIEAKRRFARCYRLTVFNPASKARRHLVRIVPAAAGTLVLLSQICHANPTVHAAGRDQLCP